MSPNDTPPLLSWADLRGRRVGVWGLGVEGRANVAVLETHDISPAIVADEAALADGGLDALGRCDVVVKSPGISRYRPEARDLVERGVVVAGGLGLWMAAAPLDRVVVVTGTKGKSTTTAVLGHMINRLGYRCFVGGNIGVMPYAPGVDDDYDYWVIEASSYQATDLPVTPAVSAATSLSPDHLPWHDNDVETYYRDKLAALSRAGAEWTVANGTSRELRDREAQLAPQVRWVDGDAAAKWAGPLNLLGAHNAVNAEIARACIELLGISADFELLEHAARRFEPLPSRLTPIGAIGHVDFIDDSLSTNVLPTLAALEACAPRRVGLIIGGHDRGIDYAPLADELASRPSVHAFAVPDSGARMAALVRERGAPVRECAALDEAVRHAYEWAQPDGVVLLSPAAPSFGRFADYRDRAAAFASAMNSLSRSARGGR